MKIMIVMKFFRVCLELVLCQQISEDHYHHHCCHCHHHHHLGNHPESNSSDSEADEKLSKELHLMLPEPEEPVKWRIRKNRKKAEENVRRTKKRQKEAEMKT